ncbi:hypothetical protein KBX06_17325 [Micromonospora sp. C31]|uniref:hypothetical protein n=1 Tax=Micromonospora sp. C31 TaxID=2824876 RepID=UPI001B365928|nr:hypothetical protein [Micromonospora sp. C31]MBQ1074913.1 hypothetical protein [Micromonospora sp. C31]
MADREVFSFREFGWIGPDGLPNLVWVPVEPGPGGLLPDDDDLEERYSLDLRQLPGIGRLHRFRDGLLTELRRNAGRAEVPATSGEHREWTAAADSYLAVARDAGIELTTAYRETDRWWSRLWPPVGTNRRRARRRRAAERYRQRLHAAYTAYLPVWELITTRDRDEAHRRVAEDAALRAAERAAERKREADRCRAYETADASRVWMFRRVGDTVWVYRNDVTPTVRLQQRPPERGPFTAPQLAGRLEDLKPIAEWIWDPAATEALEQVIGAGEAGRYWWSHESVTIAATRRAAAAQRYGGNRHATGHHGSHGVGHDGGGFTGGGPSVHV